VDRRFLSWLVLSFVIMIAWQTFVLPPPQKKPPVPPAAEGVDQPDDAPEARLAAGAQAADPQAADARAADARADDDNAQPRPGEQQPTPRARDEQAAADAPAVDAPPAVDGAAAQDQLAQEPPAPLQFVTLGSIEQQGAFRMLVTLTSQGAAVRRIELASPRYLDLHQRGGYVGHLELSADAEPGLLVRAVGLGTPAQQAGLTVGDRIVQAGVTELADATSPAEFHQLVSRIRPGRTLKLSILRDGKARQLQAQLVRRPLETIRPESENVLLREKKLPPGFEEPPSFRFTLQGVDFLSVAEDQEELPGIALRDANWRLVSSDERTAVFERRVPQWNLRVTKTYRLDEVPQDQRDNSDFPGYDLNLTIAIENGSQESHQVAYRLDGPNGLPLEGWWYAQKVGREWTVGLRDVVGRYFGATPQQIGASVIAEGNAEDFQGGSLAWIGVDAQYFSVVALPQKDSADDVWFEKVVPVRLGPQPKPRSVEGRYANVSYQMIGSRQLIGAGDSLEHTYKVFSGPKRPDLLVNYRAADNPAYALGDLVYYGWFGNIARLMVWILHLFYGLVGNYGLSIILLTALVRGLMFPISRGQAKSMAKMQELRPEMDRLKEKFKGDQQKQAQAMQELYRKHNVNPLAGCLPALIQLPVFVGLYRGLAVDVELRQAPLFSGAIRWCSNLAGPDMALDWSRFMPDMINRGEGFFGLGPYLNVLPLVTIVLFLLQQKMFMPEPANEQAALQQKMMKYMMIFMGLLFYKVPSGLCLYFIASSLWGIAERKLFPPSTVAANALGAAATTPPTADKKTRPAREAASRKNAGSNGLVGDRAKKKSKRRK
jgi:YidC/Oxa1 family membrane protein insertase